MANQLHTVLAVRDGVRSAKTDALTTLHRESQRPELYEGLTRTYRPRDESDTERLPDENKNIQINADTVLNGLVGAVTREWDLVATIDRSNQDARADVMVPTGERTSGGEVVYQTLLRDVPATSLLYLARELDDVRTFVRKLPTLDPAARWTYDPGVAAHVAEPTETHRGKKTLRNHVMYEATDRHPAQVQTFTEDVIVGFWTQLRRSGALPLERKAKLLRKVEELRVAVREARERANQVEVTSVTVAQPLFNYLLGE